MTVGRGEKNDTWAELFTVHSIPDPERARATEDLGQHAWTARIPVLHHDDRGSEVGRQRGEEELQRGDSPGRRPDDHDLERRIRARVGWRRRVIALAVHHAFLDLLMRP